jgi:hypothetical protein
VDDRHNAEHGRQWGAGHGMRTARTSIPRLSLDEAYNRHPDRRDGREPARVP